MNKILLIVLLSFLTSCSKDFSQMSWLNQYNKKQIQTRMPSSTAENCFVQQFEINQIKQEIKLLEEQWENDVVVPDKFSFTQFKPAETHYIKRYHKYIHLSEEAKQCKNLVCILNYAYDKPDGEQGYRIYHWFLTMGAGISTAMDIPGFKTDEDKSLKDYLFPNKELKALNILSKTLSKKYQDTLVSTLHRFPDGTSPREGVAGRFSAIWTTYGSSKVVKNPSAIFLTDQSLNIKNNQLSGYYPKVVAHEFSHALDFTYGPENKKDWVSDTKNWVDLSWKWGEAVVIKTIENEKGETEKVEETVMQWIPDDSKDDGFIRGYQRTSPSEDFADSGAFYIFNPEQLKKTSPNKYNIFKEEFYYGLGFEQKDYTDFYANKFQKSINENTWEIVKTCMLEVSDNQGYESKINLSNKLSYLKDDQLNCLEKHIDQLLAQKVYFLKQKDYHACQHFNNQDLNSFYEQISNESANEISQYINKLDEYKETQAAFSSYRKELKEECDPINLYIQSIQYNNPQITYDDNLKTCLDQVHERYINYGELFISERKNYYNQFDFKKAQEQTEYTFKNLMKGFQTQLKIGAVQLVDSCSMINDSSHLKDGPIHGEDLFVDASVLNCLNDKFQYTINEHLRFFLEEKYRLSEDVLNYLIEEYSPLFIKFIHLELNEININEQKIYGFSSETEITKTFAYMLKDKDILKSSLRSENNNQCYVFSYDKIKNKVHTLWKQKGWPKTISLNETVNKVLEIMCPQIMSKAKEKLQDETQSIQGDINKAVEKLFTQKHAWTKKLNHEENFMPYCKQKNKLKVMHEAKMLTESHKVVYHSIKSIFKLMINDLCHQLTNKFALQINEIKDKSSLYTDKLKPIILGDYLWQINLTKLSYMKSCSIQSQLNSKSSFIDKNEELNKFNLISASLMAKFLASDICEQLFMKWKNIDLTNIYKEHTLKNASSQYTKYIKKLEQEIEQSAMSKLELDYSKHVLECKKKYPYVRFSTMKINRKKCILSFFSQKTLDLYLSKLSHNSDLNIIQSIQVNRLKNIYREYKDNIQEHLN